MPAPQQPNKPGGKPTNARPKKITEYGQQLQEKQKVRNSYGLREAQFRRYFNQATHFRGQTGEMLLQKLESRLDNVIYRAGLAKTRAQARQLVSHRHIAINGHRVSVPSLQVTEGDVITPYKVSTLTYNEESSVPKWLKLEKKTLAVTINHLPAMDELPIEFDTQKIIEFYSR